MPDLTAGLTIAVILLPQAIAYALIAELPAQVGLYAAVVTAIIGGLWGSSNHLHTGPTNASSLLVLSILLPIVATSSPDYVTAAALLAVLAGVIRIGMAVAKLGILVNFVSDAVIVGFTSGAGLLIGVNQLRHFFGLDLPSSASLPLTLKAIAENMDQTHVPTFGLGLAAIVIIVALKRFAPKAPAPLAAMVVCATLVALLQLEGQGVKVIGEIPKGLPPITLHKLPWNWDTISQLSTGAVAIAAIGLIEAMSIGRSIASKTGQRIDSSQEFIGQGLANIATGCLSGYPCAGSLSRSVINYEADAQTPFAAVFSGIFVLIAMFALGTLTAFVPRTALAGVLIVTAYGMVNRQRIKRIWHGARGDAIIMVVTLAATLLLPLQVAVMSGIFMSLALYILTTSVPKVVSVLPNADFEHYGRQGHRLPCPQLGIMQIMGDLYFGATNHIEEQIYKHMNRYPEQRFLLLRMHSVNQCDISGVYMLESVVKGYREKGGDVFFVRVSPQVREVMQNTGFDQFLGENHIFTGKTAIDVLFHKVLDPAICIYECEVRAFLECQNLPKSTSALIVPLQEIAVTEDKITYLTALEIRDILSKKGEQPIIIDVREPREYYRGHIPYSIIVPLPQLITDPLIIPSEQFIILVCRGGRRSGRAARRLIDQGYTNVKVLRGGMLAWEAAGLLTAVDSPNKGASWTT